MLHVDEDMPLFSTGFENGDTFMETLMKCGKKVEAFLHRDKHIPVRGTTVLPYELAHIDTTLDTDGVVIEWNDLTGCTLSLTHLQIAPKGVANLKSFYPILRKHVSANDYNPTVRKHLRESVAIQLFYTDGWETWCGFVATNDCTFIPTSDVIRKLSLQAFNHMKRVFEQNMKEMIKSGRAVNTGIKNNLNDLSKMFILPDDRALVMTALKSAMDDTKFEIDGFKKLVVTFRFGEKGQTELPLPFTDRQTVARITVHIGLSLSFNFADRRVSHLFWCREGIQSLVGGRGQLTTALSFMECVNFQSNLDGRLMTLDRRLREVCRYPDQLTFIQFYSDTPHRSPKCRMHPVSGVVTILEDLFNGYRHIKNDAKIYLDEVDNNVEQLGKCVARLEIVTAVPISTQSVKPDKIMNVDKFTNLLTNYPLLVPFIHAEFIETIQHIGRYFVQLLKRHFVISSGTGNSIAAWECYQAELALEKLFWGHPRCYLSNLYSINLGPGVGNPSRSCTDAMGFLCLENSGSCCVDEFTTPPLAIYSKTDCVQKQISKTFGVINIIDAGSRVLGRRIISVLLDDLHDIGNVYGRLEEFQMQLKCSKNPTAKVVSGCSRQQIAELLANAQKAKYPMVITRLFSVLRKHGLDILQILQDGLCDLGLVYFPAVRFYDRQRNEGLYWQWNFGFWIITDVSSAADEIEQKSNSYTALVVWEVEKQKLFHSSTISGKTLPWVRPVLEKLSDLNLSQDDLVSILTFVTCVARLMQGAYVDFSALSKLERAIPLSQNKLRLRQIQSKILIQQFNKFKLWRLHASIPYKIQDSVSITLTRDEPRQRNVTDDTDTNQYIDMHDYAEDEVENNVIMQIPPKHLATETKTRWSPIELNIVGPLKQLCDSLSDRDIYVKYQSECLAMGIPDRPFRAFRLKLHRL